jgi:hypothetical protein
MRIPIWPGVRLSVWEPQNSQAVNVTLACYYNPLRVRRVLSMRGWMLLGIRYDWRDRGVYATEPGVRQVRILVQAPTDENAAQWAQTIRDLVVAEHGQDMRLTITITPEEAR